MFSASAALTATIKDTTAQLGFVDLIIAPQNAEVGNENENGDENEVGEVVGLLSGSFTPPDPNADGRITAAELIEVVTSLSDTVTSDDLVMLGEEFSGNLQIDIGRDDGSVVNLVVPFGVTSSADMSQVRNQLNAELETLSATIPEASRIHVGSLAPIEPDDQMPDREHLTFELTDSDGIASVVVRADAASRRLGVTQDLSIFRLNPEITASASFHLPYQLNLFDLNISGVLPAQNQVFAFEIPDLTNPDFNLAQALSIDLDGIGDHLNRLKSLDLETIVETLQGALDFLRGIEGFEDAPFMNQPLPLLNTDLNSILNTADVFGDLIVQMNANPAEGIGQIDEILEDLLGIKEGDGTTHPNFAVSIFPELNANLSFAFDDGGTSRLIELDNRSAFDNKNWFGGQFDDLNAFLQSPLVQGDNTTAVELTLDSESFDTPALRIDLNLQVGNGFGFEVEPLGVQVPVSIGLADIGFDGLTDFVDARGDALIDVSARGEISLALGIELQDEGLPTPFLYDGTQNGTSLDLLVHAAASDINFDVAVGPLGARLEDGMLGFGGTSGPDSKFARFSVGLADDNGDGRHFFNEIVTNVADGLSREDFEFSGDGGATFDGSFDFPGLDLGLLTTPFPALSFPMAFDFRLPDITSVTDGLTRDEFTVSIGGQDPAALLEEARSILAGDFNVLSLVGGWDGAFDLIISAMEGEVFGVELPFIGDKLKEQATFLRNIKDSVTGNLSDNSQNEEDEAFSNPFQDVRQDLFDALGDGGIGLLRDLTGDGAITIDDVVIEQLHPGIGFEILLGSDLAELELPIDFDLGIPGLNLDIDANVTGSLGFELGLKMGVNLDHGFFIDTNDSFLEVFVDVGVPSLSASGEFGFLRVDASEILTPAVAHIGRDEHFESQFSISSIATGSAANFDVRFIPADLADGAESGAYSEADDKLILTIDADHTTAQDLVDLINNDPQLSQQFSAEVHRVDFAADDAVDSAANTITIKGHSFKSGSPARYDANGGTVIGGLADGTDYFVIVVDADTIQLATTPENATAGTPVVIDLTAGTTSGEKHRLHSGAGLVKSDQRGVGVSNSFTGRFEVDILDPGEEKDGLLTLSEILAVSEFSEVISIKAVAVADLNLHLSAMIGTSGNFPSIHTDLSIDWDFELGSDLQLPTVALTNIELGLGGFLNGFAEGVFAEVENVIEPVRPIVEFLNEPLPVVSDLGGGDVSLLDLLELNKSLPPAVIHFIRALDLLDGIIQSIPDIGDERLPMGSATFDPNTGEFTLEGGAFAAMKEAFESATAGMEDFDSSQFTKSEEEVEDTPDSELKLGFPILNPSNVLKLLSGEVVDLFTLELPTLTLEASLKKFFPLPPFPVVGVEVAGTFSAVVDLAFGFDTFGIEQYKQTGNIANIINGFFVFDHETADGEGEDLSELVFGAEVTAAAALTTGILDVRVGGGLFADIEFNLHDNNDDGKIRLVELLDNTLLGGKDGFGPIHTFDVGGRFDAGLFAEITADLGLFQVDQSYEIAQATLFEFEFPRPTGEGVQLAQYSDGTFSGGNGSTTLELNIGPNAARRENLFTDDDAEDYKVFAGSAPGVVIVEAFGRSQVYTDVNRITGNAGMGNDTIFISEDLTIPVDISGGSGSDVITGGSGPDRLQGDNIIAGDTGAPGDDTVLGGDGDDTIWGGDGRDRLFGERGNDLIFGGADDDTIIAGDGDDTASGDGGDDTIRGGAGADVIRGGFGFDIIFGEGSDDQLDGEGDADQIHGGDGADLITGGGGDDLLFGNDGNDVIYTGTITLTSAGDVTDHTGSGADTVRGGVGNDLIVGDSGPDHLLGENSRDTIWGGAGDDLIEGGQASDQLFGGLGNDTLYFNTSDLSVEDEASHVLGGGGGDDLIYASPLAFDNRISGDGVNDIFGHEDSTTDGSDEIHAGAGHDLILAGGLHDTVFAGAGDDFVDAGSGNDTVLAGDGDDFVIGGFGDDDLFGEGGNDVVWGGLAAISDPAAFDRADATNFTLPPQFDGLEQQWPTGYVPPVNVTPAAVDYQTVPGVEGDGRDLLRGGPGIDALFGGADPDVVLGGDGPDYIDAGAGHDINVQGGAGDDVVRGGGNNDILRGGPGIDHVMGDGGDDELFGDSGTGVDGGILVGQRLIGGDGGDELNAWAPTTVATTEAAFRGDQMFGEDGPDTLNGNLRQELLVGGGDNDLLRGDYLDGPDYSTNENAATIGAPDRLFGDGGEDQLFGGGGNDEAWGGPDTDYFDGQQGDDTQYGGGGNDLFVVSAVHSGQKGNDIIDGHFGDFPGDTESVDDSTDILIIDGTMFDDTIGLSQMDADDVPHLTLNPNLKWSNGVW